MLITISSKGQITIPKSIRKSLNLETGDTLALIQVDDEIILRPVKETMFDLVGLVPPLDEPKSEREIRDATRDYVVSQYHQSEKENE